MPVPHDDLLCRFIRPSDWSNRDKRPKSAAFKGPNLSLWHLQRLADQNVSIDALRFGDFDGAGQAHYTPSDYITAAADAAASAHEDFSVTVEWRGRVRDVKPAYTQWRYAHAQVEWMAAPENAFLQFRQLLALQAHKRARALVPPDN